MRAPRRRAPVQVVLITDPTYGDARICATIAAAARALPAGALQVQLRDKTRAPASLLTFATELAALTAGLGAMLVVNGDAEVALRSGAAGVHLGYGALGGRGSDAPAGIARRMGCAWVSVATHSDDEVSQALVDGADAVVVSPIFDVPGKGPPRGTRALASARARAGQSLAIYALGGMTASNAGSAGVSGADGVAVVRALFDADDPGRQARAIYDALVLGCSFHGDVRGIPENHD